MDEKDVGWLSKSPNCNSWKFSYRRCMFIDSIEHFTRLNCLSKSHWISYRTRTSIYGNRKYFIGNEKAGIYRQECHEKLRILSHEASNQVKQNVKKNDLIERIKIDDYFKPIINQLDLLMDPKSFTGRAAQQVVEFYDEKIKPLLKRYDKQLRKSSAIVNLSIWSLFHSWQ